MAEEAFSESDWVQLVKRTREKFGVGLDEAHDLIFQDETMRRLVALKVNRNPRCRKQAMSNIRYNGEQSRFVIVDGKIYFRGAAPGGP